MGEVGGYFSADFFALSRLCPVGSSAGPSTLGKATTGNQADPDGAMGAVESVEQSSHHEDVEGLRGITTGLRSSDLYGVA